MRRFPAKDLTCIERFVESSTTAFRHSIRRGEGQQRVASRDPALDPSPPVSDDESRPIDRPLEVPSHPSQKTCCIPKEPAGETGHRQRQGGQGLGSQATQASRALRACENSIRRGPPEPGGQHRPGCPRNPAVQAGVQRWEPKNQAPARPAASEAAQKREAHQTPTTRHQQHDTNNTRIRESGPQNQPTNTSAKAKPTNTSTKAKPPNASAKPKRGPRADKAHHHPSSHPQKWAVTNPEPHVTAPSQPLSTLEKGMDTNTARSENASI